MLINDKLKERYDIVGVRNFDGSINIEYSKKHIPERVFINESLLRIAAGNDAKIIILEAING